MAFVLATDNPHLSCVSGEKRDSAPSIYAFRTLSTEANVIAAGFFNTLSDILKIGDILMIVTVTGTQDVPTGVADTTLCTVVSNAAGVVDVSNNYLGAHGDST